MENNEVNSDSEEEVLLPYDPCSGRKVSKLTAKSTFLQMNHEREVHIRDPHVLELYPQITVVVPINTLVHISVINERLSERCNLMFYSIFTF